MSAVISPCGRYRYRLERETSQYGGQTAVVMVNPSTADAVENDQTIKKLIGFGQRNGWGRVVVGNLFAYRARDVRELGKVADPVGPENDDHLALIAMQSDRVVFAWGPVSKQPKWRRDRWRGVNDLFRRNGHIPLCIGPVAKCGHPKHPQMLAYELPIVPWCAP